MVVRLNKKRKSANKTPRKKVVQNDSSKANQIQRRKSFAHWIKNRFSREKCRSILFSDEKWFDQDGQYKRQNGCVYAESREVVNKDSVWHKTCTQVPIQSHTMDWDPFSRSYRHRYFDPKNFIWCGVLHQKCTTSSKSRWKQMDWARFHLSTRRRYTTHDWDDWKHGLSLIGSDIWPPNSQPM